MRAFFYKTQVNENQKVLEFFDVCQVNLEGAKVGSNS